MHVYPSPSYHHLFSLFIFSTLDLYTVSVINSLIKKSKTWKCNIKKADKTFILASSILTVVPQIHGNIIIKVGNH